MRISLKSLKSAHPYFAGPTSEPRSLLVVAGGKEIIRVKTWVISDIHVASVSMFSQVAGGLGKDFTSRESAIYKACEDAGVVFQGDPRDNIRVMLKKLARAKGYRGKILILEV